MTTKPVSEAMRETVEFCARALARIERAEGADTELHNIRAYVENTLEMIEPDAGVREAADAFVEEAARFVADLDGAPGSPVAESSAERRKGVELALAELREALMEARPSERGRGMGLV